MPKDVLIQKLMTDAVEKLTAAGVYAPLADCEMMMARLKGCAREDVQVFYQTLLSPQEHAQFNIWVERRLQREPLARIFGEIEFANITLKMTDGVFEPMIETQSLVEHAALLYDGKAPRILDIGTGSGAFLLGTLKALPRASGLGIDTCEKAIALAKENAQLNQLAERAQFNISDLASHVDEKFDLIFSNLPFVPRSYLSGLMPEVTQFNPAHTLDGGHDGFDMYRKLIKQIDRLCHTHTYWIVQTSINALTPMQCFFKKAGYQEAKRLDNHYGIPVGFCIKPSSKKHSVSRLWPF